MTEECKIGELIWLFSSIGNNKTSSTSNTKNSKEMAKKCKEKKVRMGLCGIKPHSKGLAFS